MPIRGDPNCSANFKNQGRSYKVIDRDSRNMTFYIQGVDKTLSNNPFVQASCKDMKKKPQNLTQSYPTLKQKEKEVYNLMQPQAVSLQNP